MKTSRCRMWIPVILLGISFGCCQCDEPQVVVAEEPTRDGVFLHISHGGGDAHRVLMALKMAEMMAADKDVLVYFDIQGIEVVLAEGEDITSDHFPNSHAQLATLQELGVPLFACPGCLKAAGKTPEDLAPGIQVAEKAAFFNFTEGRILTLDY